MAEDIKGLIEKIQQEGIKAAQEKAREIEDDAGQKAQVIIKEAKKEAQKIIAEANEKNARIEMSTKASLKQAGRDLLLALRKEIDTILDRLIISRIREALTPKELVKIITALIKSYSGKDKGNIIISLKKKDLEKLKKGLFSQLGQKVKQGITLRPSEDISSGFIISYDANRSHYDFTDKALAEYIGSYIKPKLKEVFEGIGSIDKKQKRKG